MKKKIEIFFQVILICLLIKIFYFDRSFIFNINNIITHNFYYLLFFIIGINLFIAFLFYIIVSTITISKVKFIDSLQIFLQGGLVNQFIPTSGLIFRYYKFRIVSNVTLPEYTVSQLIFSIYSLSSYIFLGALFGLFAFITIDFNKILVLVLLLFILCITIFFTRKKIFYIIKLNLLKFSSFNKFIKNFSNIKNKLKSNIILFTFILFGFLFLTFLECWAFYQTLQIFNIEINFLTAAILWISASIISVLAIINFFGFFEIILAISALTLINETLGGMVIIAFTFRLLYIVAQIILIFYSFFHKLIK